MKDEEKTVKDLVSRNAHNHNPEGKGGFGSVDVQPGDNARYVRHSLAIMNLPPINIANAEEVQERIVWYFDHCQADDMKPTVSGMALALGVDRKTVYNWARGESRGDSHFHIVKKAMDMLESLWEDYMQNGKINPVSGIFLGKNHFGYQDKQEIVVEPKNPLGEAEDPEEIKRKYLAEQNPDNPDD